VAGLTPADGSFIVGDGANFVAESGATARTSLGLGTAATSNTGDFLASTAGLNDLSDVSFTAGPGIDNYVLTYDNASSSWGAEAAAGGGYSVTVDTTTISTTNPTTLSSPSDNEEVYIISNSTTDVTVNLVAAATCGSGFKYTFKVLGTGVITLDPNGTEYIDFAAQTTFAIGAQYDSVSLQTDGSNWYLV